MQLDGCRLGLLATAALAVAAVAAPSAASAAVPSAAGAAPAAAVAKKLTPTQLAAASKAAFLKASSVRIRSIGGRFKGEKISIDVHAGTTTCEGVFNLGKLGVLRLKRIDTKVWFTGNDALWKTAGIDPVAAAGKWAATDVNDTFWQPLILTCAIPVEAELAFPKGLKWAAAPSKVVGKVATTGIKPASAKIKGVYAYIPAKGAPLVSLEVIPGGWTQYQEWNKRLAVVAPDAATILA